MHKKIVLTDNGIKTLLDINNINKEEATDIYLKIIDFKLLDEKKKFIYMHIKR